MPLIHIGILYRNEKLVISSTYFDVEEYRVFVIFPEYRLLFLILLMHPLYRAILVAAVQFF